jgi:hypothetical protein
MERIPKEYEDDPEPFINKRIADVQKSHMIGLIAQLFGLSFEKKGDLATIWEKVLFAKYQQNKEHRDVLLSTSGTYLVYYNP